MSRRARTSQKSPRGASTPSWATPNAKADHLSVAIVDLPMDGSAFDVNEVSWLHLDDSLAERFDANRSRQQVGDDVVVAMMVPGVLTR
jgi:hypothetical protein